MPTEKIFIPNSFGQKISAVVHRPQEKNQTLVIICPGYLDTKDYGSFVKMAEDLSEIGFTAVRFDPSGIWESEGQTKDYSLSQYLKDVRSVINSIKEKETFEKTILIGHSLGGLVSLLFASQNEDLSAVVGIMPPYSMTRPGKEREEKKNEDWAKNGFALVKRDLPFQANEEKEFQVPISVIQDAYQYNLLEVASQITVPTLLLAGENDTTIPEEDVKLIFESLKAPKEFFILPNIGHDYRLKEEEIELVNKKVIDFLTNLG